MKIYFQSTIGFVFLTGTKLFGQTNSENVLPKLSPPYGELPPTFWEQNGTAVMIFGVAILIFVALVILFFSRAKPKPIIPPEVQARKILEKLRQQTETGEIVSRVSQAFQNYFIATFQLPAGEFTTAEFSRMISNHEPIGSELSTEAINFLHDCNTRKFSATKTSAPLNAADRALNLVERAEQKRLQLQTISKTKSA